MPISLERFLNVRSATSPTFSPDGRHVAFISNVTGVAQLWQLPVGGGWPTQLTFFNDSVRTANYNPVRHELVFSMDTGGNERTQLYLLRGTGAGKEHGLGEGWDVTNLTDDPKAIHTFGGWSNDGMRIAFSANKTKQERFDVYVQDVPAGDGQPAAARLLKEGPGGYYQPVGWSPDDQWLLIARAESNFNHDLYVVNVATGETKHLTPHQGDVVYQSPKWATDGKSTLCATTHGGRDKAVLAEIELPTGRATFVREPQHEVESIEIPRKADSFALTLNDNGRTQLWLGSQQGKVRPTQIEGLPLGVCGALEFSPDAQILAFTMDGPRNNPDVWLYHLAQQAKPQPATQLTRSSRAGIPFSQLPEPELVTYKSFDGLDVPAWYYPPSQIGIRQSATGNLPPVIVYPHGGPESQTRPIFNAIFHYFSQAGYAIFAPNVRGSSGYGMKFMNLDNTTKRMDSVADMAHGVYWLRDNKKADPKRVAVYGGSYGGFMVLAGVTNYPELFAAGVDIVGIANWVTFLENTGAYRRANREAEYGNLREHKDFLVKISPIHHVDKIKCPMMVIHGANDPRVPIGEAEQIVAALKQRGIPVEYLRYEDEGHGLAKLKNRLDAYPKMVAFLDKYVKGSEEAAPAGK